MKFIAEKGRVRSKENAHILVDLLTHQPTYETTRTVNYLEENFKVGW